MKIKILIGVFTLRQPRRIYVDARTFLPSSNILRQPLASTRPLILAEAAAKVSLVLQNANLIYLRLQGPWKNPAPGTATTPACLISSSTNSICNLDIIQKQSPKETSLLESEHSHQRESTRPEALQTRKTSPEA